MSKDNHSMVFGDNVVITRNDDGQITREPLQRDVVIPDKNGRVKKAAFTLTEVLLAVLIVGIIAAMVLPAIITKYQDKVLGSAFNREIHSLQDSINSLVAVENKSTFSETSIATDTETYMKKYLRVSKYCGTSGKDCFAEKYYEYQNHEKKAYTPSFNGTCSILKNGTSVCLSVNGNNIDMLIDVNGPKAPNVFGRDLRAYTYSVKDKTGYNMTSSGVIALNNSPVNSSDPDPDPDPTPDPCAGKTCGCGALPACLGNINATFTLKTTSETLQDSYSYHNIDKMTFSVSGTGIDKISNMYVDVSTTEDYCQSNGCSHSDAKNIYIYRGNSGINTCENYRSAQDQEEEINQCDFSSPPYNVYGTIEGKSSILCVLNSQNSSCSYKGTYKL